MKRSNDLVILMLLFSTALIAQQNVTLKVSPEKIEIPVGKELALEVKAFDDSGNELNETQTFFFPVQRKGVEENMIFPNGILVDSTGVIKARLPGVYDVFVNRLPEEGQAFANKQVQVTVVNQPVAQINLSKPSKIYEDQVYDMNFEVIDEGGFAINNPDIDLRSSNPEVFRVDDLMQGHAIKKGKATVIASVGDVNTKMFVEVLPNPVARVEINVPDQKARTGDVLNFEGVAYDKSGNRLTEVPLTYAVFAQPAEAASGASAQVDKDGRFVAEKPGVYSVIVSSGNQANSTTVEIKKRDIEQKIVKKGQGRVSAKATSDLWVWQGVDGKDYAVTGTWGADGKAYFWEVTDPSAITLIDSIHVDARTVNDVKVSEDGKIAIISREGASNRKNGIVILDVTNPADVKELSVYTENLTGGVHNLFIDNGYVYALSNAQWYEIIDIKDPKNPKGVSKFKLPNSGEAIHDVWIEDGIAYSSNWSDGIVMVDVGNGIAGGSPENPVEIARARVEGDANHAAFPYKSKDTGKFYVVAGDEIFPMGDGYFLPSGYLHFIDMTDLENPKEVARYEVPEAGSHNFWIEDDKLYVAYYQGGLRVVDISGDLMGNLYEQGREIAYFLPYDTEGYMPNAPFTWGTMPYKGHIFFSDMNSGLWAVQMMPKDNK